MSGFANFVLQRRTMLTDPPQQQEDTMAWRKPRIVEISVAMEINCYACAEV